MNRFNSNFILFLIFSVLLCLQLTSNFSNSDHPMFIFGVWMRSVQLATAIALAIYNFTEKKKYTLSAFMLFSMFLQIPASFAVGPSGLAAYNYIPLFFVVASLGFDGSNKVWWQRFVPLSLIPLILPLFFKDSSLFSSVGVVADNFMMTIFAVVASIGFSHLIMEKNLYRNQLEELSYKQKDVISSQANALANLKVEAEINKLARQVAHDIRSPLNALNIVLNKADGMSDAHKKVLNSLGARINEVANDLLSRSKQKIERRDSRKFPIKTDYMPPEPEEIRPLISELLSEKKLEFSSFENIKLSSFLSNESSEVLCRVEPCQFKRVVSNLINNSVESISGKGLVTIGLEVSENQLLIEVRDTGRGISQENMADIFEGRSTKSCGNGIGLSHAKHWVNKWGGDLKIYSKERLGTTAVIHLPIEKPSNFQSHFENMC